MNQTPLRRRIGLPLLILYGLGTILGAGIYVLIGEVAQTAGHAAPAAFVLAALLAGVTALSFAELSSRLPRSAAEASYAEAAFHSQRLAQAVGWVVILIGVVSAATMIRGFIGYLDVFVQWPHALVSAGLVAMLAIVAFWGIGESLAVIVASRGLPPEIIAAISLFAVVNGALIQIIMASRMLFGLARDGLAWRPLAYVHPRTQTPAVGTFAVASVILLLTLFFSLSGLARATSFLALAIFAVVNLALWRLKGMPGPVPDFVVPRLVPLAGFALCLGMIASEGLRSL